MTHLHLTTVLHILRVHADAETVAAGFRSLDGDHRRGEALSGRESDGEIGLRHGHAWRRVKVNVLDSVRAGVNDGESARVLAPGIALELAVCGSAAIRQLRAHFHCAAGSIFGHQRDEEAGFGSRLHVSQLHRNGG